MERTGCGAVSENLVLILSLMVNPMSMLLRWLLTHLVAFTFLGFVVVAVTGREILFGITPAPVQIQPPPVAKPVIQEPAVPASTDAAAATDPADVRLVSPTIPPPGEAIVAEPEPQIPRVRAPQLNQQPMPVPVPAQETAPDPVTAAPLSADAPAQGAFRPPMEGVDGPLETEELRENSLQQARRSFWNGSLEDAESGYLEYLTAYPDDANVFGELGNLYQSMGRTEDAQDAYFEAGVRLKKYGDSAQLQQITEFLQEAGDSRATRLAD